MSTRALMIAAAALLAACGLVLSFAAEEVITALGGHAPGLVPVLVQLAGALYLGFAMVDWTAKGMVLGGIYGRAIVLGNFLHFTMGAMALLKVALHPQAAAALWSIAAIYALFAVLFMRLLFGSPKAAS
jgi:hypothetical protein